MLVFVILATDPSAVRSDAHTFAVLNTNESSYDVQAADKKILNLAPEAVTEVLKQFQLIRRAPVRVVLRKEDYEAVFRELFDVQGIVHTMSPLLAGR